MKVPTAKEFLEKNCLSFSESLIEFARLHVQECKKEIVKKAYVKDPVTGGTVYASSRKMNNAYPLSKIK